MIQAKLVTCTVLMLALGGCGMQATSGLAWTRHHSTPTLTVAAASMGYRQSRGVVGMRVGMDIDKALVPKNGIVHGGYDCRLGPGWFVFEPGFDLGLGGPIESAYDSVGAYLGASATARVRLAGVNDNDPAFNVVAPIGEVVLTGRGGGWMPPEDAASARLVGEWSAELGVRFSLGSDLVTAAQGKVRPPVEGHDSKPARAP
ncbi:MAG TPA: hypothetical protein VG734_23075 [Lacunisphaera sp.]|nr:hypothetical protein [Lacunisphaera sp.]